MSTRTASINIAILGIVVSVVACLINADYNIDWTLLLVPLFTAWVAAPFVIALRLARRTGLAKWVEILILIVVSLVTIATCFAYLSFSTRTVFDAQDGLVFAVIPVYQLIAMAILYAVVEAVSD